MSYFHSLFLYFLRSCGIRKSVLMVSLIGIAISMASCRSTKEFQIVRDSIVVEVHDTITFRDTIRKTEVKHDSVDRYVEKVVYVDSNGVVHEKEIERLTRLISSSDTDYQNTIRELKREASILENRLSESREIEYVEKPLKTSQKLLIFLGRVFIFVVIGVSIGILIGLKKTRKV